MTVLDPVPDSLSLAVEAINTGDSVVLAGPRTHTRPLVSALADTLDPDLIIGTLDGGQLTGDCDVLVPPELTDVDPTPVLTAADAGRAILASCPPSASAEQTLVALADCCAHHGLDASLARHLVATHIDLVVGIDEAGGVQWIDHVTTTADAEPLVQRLHPTPGPTREV
ncbi:hypothetical protein [Dietzia cercidiphylli]|uniref:hypothetical protein n=1 Tax=Dietzia cercidiphylli TaxID=498199 RepID=UPI00223BBEA4|nr:hypothetical protein [Dietzia cercidiphylli]MCT1516510.1 hypothetical protein [Dietzia cercidiphylli]